MAGQVEDKVDISFALDSFAAISLDEPGQELTRPGSGAEPGLRIAPRRAPVSELRVLLLVAGVGLLGVLMWSQRHLLTGSAATFRTFEWVWIPAALAAEALSMLTFGLAHRRLLRAGGVRLTVRTVTAIALAGNAISSSVPVAGSELGTAYTFRQFRRHHADRVTTSWVLALSGVTSSLTFAVIVGVAAVASHNLAATAAGLAATIVVAGAVALAVIAVRTPALRATLERAAVTAVQIGGRVLRRPPGQPAAAVRSASERVASLRLNRRDMSTVAATSSVNWLSDILCLAFAVAAVRASIPWPAVILVWAAGATVSAFQLTPGGLGVVEAAMIAALVVAGVHTGPATAAVLTYRAISYWLPVLTGWAILGHQHHQPAPAADPSSAHPVPALPTSTATPHGPPWRDPICRDPICRDPICRPAIAGTAWRGGPAGSPAKRLVRPAC